MKRDLYNKIAEYLKKGHKVSVNFYPYHKGCDVRIISDLKKIENSKELKDEFLDWWYEELLEGILIPNDVLGGGKFKFVIDQEALFVNSTIKINEDESTELTDFIDQSILDWLKIKSDNLIQKKEYLCFEFDYTNENSTPIFKNFILSYYLEGKDKYKKITLSKADINTLKEIIDNIIQKWPRLYSEEFKNPSYEVYCSQCNSCSIYEGFDFDFKVPKNDL